MRPLTRLEGKPRSFAIFVQFISLPILSETRKTLPMMLSLGVFIQIIAKTFWSLALSVVICVNLWLIFFTTGLHPL
jgi:hypothetical protein